MSYAAEEGNAPEPTDQITTRSQRMLERLAAELTDYNLKLERRIDEARALLISNTADTQLVIRTLNGEK